MRAFPKPKQSYCSQCEKEGYYHRGLCDNLGSKGKENEMSLIPRCARCDTPLENPYSGTDTLCEKCKEPDFNAGLERSGYDKPISGEDE